MDGVKVKNAARVYKLEPDSTTRVVHILFMNDYILEVEDLLGT